MGIFYPLVDDTEVRLIATEAAGKGVETGLHASSITGGEVGVLHGNKTFLLQDEDGQIQNAFSISAGLDYPGIGPEHAHYHKSGRAEYVPITDDEAVDALLFMTREEGIIPALESAHAVAQAIKTAKEMTADQIMVINVSGRGDKDMMSVNEYLESQGRSLA